MKLAHVILLFVISGLSLFSNSAFCIQVNRRTCPTFLGDAEIQAQKMAEISCKAELSDLKCDQFFETEAERTEFERHCPSSSEIPKNGYDLGMVCAKQVLAPAIDGTKFLISYLVAGMKKGMKDADENRAKFIAECDRDPHFKAATAKSIPLFSNSTQEQIGKIPCAYLVAELEETQQREKENRTNQNAEAAYRKYVSLLHEPATATNDFLSSLIRHNRDKLKCVNQAGQYAMYCYGFFSVIDPSMLIAGAGAVAKGARLLKLFDSFGEATKLQEAARLARTLPVEEIAVVKPPVTAAPDLTKIQSALGGELSFTEKQSASGKVTTVFLKQDGDSIGDLTYAYENGELTIVNMDSDIQKQGIGTALVQQALAKHPGTTRIVAETVAQANRMAVETARKAGASLEDAIRTSPAYKIRERLGFSRIVSIDPVSYSFTVMRP